MIIMKFNLKKIFTGILVTSLAGTSTVAYAESNHAIQAIFSRVQLIVNDRTFAQDIILYNDTTYIPLRAVAEVLTKEVVWEDSTRTIYIKDKSLESSEPASDGNNEKAVQEDNKEEAKPEEAKEDNKEEVKPEEAKEEKKEQKLPFRIGSVEYELYVLYNSDDSAVPGYVYPPEKNKVAFEHYFANRTKYTIISISHKVFDMASRKERTLSIYQYVKPNFVSDVFREEFNALNPPSTQTVGQKDDLEWWETTVKFLNDNGEEVTLKYDYRKDEYTVTGN
ncbi:MAG: copper amine oxidase N-terminal domain-containing protein, partial [Lachnospiraceae bacterium]|nr:copper amine oxidase N-terminal domain-containing protein [Lachnospiraceae bacterium]